MNRGEYQVNYLTAFLIAIHLSIALPLAFHLNIWADEASTLYTTNDGLVAAIHGALDNERQAPLYFAILALWREISHSIFFARLFSIGCSVIAIKLFSDLVFRCFRRSTAIAALAFFALHPFLFWASLEIRAYSLAILLSVLLVSTFIRAFPQTEAEIDSGSRWPYVWFLIVSLISLYTNYYLGFMFVGLFVILVSRGQWRQTGIYCALMFIAGVFFLPLASAVAAQMALNTGGFQGERPLALGVRILWHHVLTFLLPAEVIPDNSTSAVAALRLNIVRVSAVLLLISLFLRWRQLSSRTVSFVISAFTLSALFVSAFLLLGENYVALRHASVIFVPLILALTSFLSDLFSGEQHRHLWLARSASAVLVLVVLSFFTYSVWTLYPGMKKRGDWQNVASFIEARETPGQPILVFTTYDALALQVYYKGVNPVLPNRNYFDFDLEDTFGSENSLRKRIDFAISEIPTDSTQLWLVESEKCITTDACIPLENFVEANYTVIQQQDFYLERVRLLTKKRQ